MMTGLLHGSRIFPQSLPSHYQPGPEAPSAQAQVQDEPVPQLVPVDKHPHSSFKFPGFTRRKHLTKKQTRKVLNRYVKGAMKASHAEMRRLVVVGNGEAAQVAEATIHLLEEMQRLINQL